MNAALIGMMVLASHGFRGAETPTVQVGGGFSKVFELKVTDFDNFKVTDDRFEMNTFIVRENADGRRGQSVIKFGANVRNKAKGYETFSVMIVGFDETKTPLWVSKAVSSVDGNWLGTIQDYETSVPKGTLKLTSVVWMKIMVSANSDEE